MSKLRYGFSIWVCFLVSRRFERISASRDWKDKEHDELSEDKLTRGSLQSTLLTLGNVSCYCLGTYRDKYQVMLRCDKTPGTFFTQGDTV